jgi:uncharacterized protein (DUF1810 family)
MVLAPPVDLQTAFAERIEHIDALGRRLDAIAAKAQAIAGRLSAEVFGAPAIKERHDSMAKRKALMATDAD